MISGASDQMVFFCRGASSAAATTESSMMKMQPKCQSSVVGGEVEVLTLNTTTS